MSHRNVFILSHQGTPDITIPESSYSVMTGNSIIVPCNVSATPDAESVYWQISDSQTGSNPTNLTTTGPKYDGGNIATPSLTINVANQTIDEGYYRCLATNAAGVGQSGLTFVDVWGSKWCDLWPCDNILVVVSCYLIVACIKFILLFFVSLVFFM